MRTAKKYRAMALAAMAADPGHPWHGTYAGYTYGCGCEKCRAAAREHRLAFRARFSLLSDSSILPVERFLGLFE